MNKIAILSCAKSAATCCGVDCLRFFAERERSFAAYANRPVQLAGLTLCCGCEVDPGEDAAFEGKLDHLIKAGVAQVHVSACVTSQKKNCPRKDKMFEMIRDRGMEVCYIERGIEA